MKIVETIEQIRKRERSDSQFYRDLIDTCSSAEYLSKLYAHGSFVAFEILEQIYEFKKELSRIMQDHMIYNSDGSLAGVDKEVISFLIKEFDI